MKYRVQSSNEKLEINNATVGDDDHQHALRRKITWFLLSLASLFLIASAVYGAVTHDFSGLSSVWNEAKSVLAIVVGYYFGKLSSERANK